MPVPGVGDFLVAGLMKTWFYNGLWTTMWVPQISCWETLKCPKTHRIMTTTKIKNKKYKKNNL